MTRGRFVVVEGGDGSGKSTQVERLASALRTCGLRVVETFEPGATPLGSVLRELLLHSSEPVAPITEALLMAADRAQHVAEVVAPALDRGDWVVSDRHLPSSLAYQGMVRGLGVEAVREMNRAAIGETVPDAVVVLDVPEVVARTRRGGVPDRMEAEAAEFHERVARAYRELADQEGWVVVDGTDDPVVVAECVFRAIAPLLAG